MICDCFKFKVYVCCVFLKRRGDSGILCTILTLQVQQNNPFVWYCIPNTSLWQATQNSIGMTIKSFNVKQLSLI